MSTSRTSAFRVVNSAIFTASRTRPNGPTSPRSNSMPKIEETLALGGDQLLLPGRPAPKLGIDFYENLFREPENALSADPTACARRARSIPYRPDQRAGHGNDAATAGRRGTRLAARSRSRNPRQRGAAGRLARQTERRPMARCHAHRAPPRPGDLGDDDVRARRNAAATHRTPDPDPRPAGRMSGRKLRIHRLHPVDLPRERNAGSNARA